MAQQCCPSTHALYPGTFDPPTFGHLSIIKRGARLFDKLTVGVANLNGKDTLLAFEKRFELIKKLTSDMPNIEVISFSGLLVQCAESINAGIILRGLRTVSDFDYEYRMSTTNQIVLPGLETVFLMAEPEYGYISSTLVRQIASCNGDIARFVPELVLEALKEGK